MSPDNHQLMLPFDEPFSANDRAELWTPRDIWVKFTQRMLSYFAEDRRIEYKQTPHVHWDDLAKYLSGFSNSPDGGVICYGVANDGTLTGCRSLSQEQLNRVENCHISMCPQSRPEIKRLAITIDGNPDFLVLIYIPCSGKLVETNKGEAWMRYGDQLHKMTEEEKRDFRSTRNELSFELDVAPYQYPEDFDPKIIQDFCDIFRQREGRDDWSDEEILVDRFLAKQEHNALRPFNALALLAAKDPRKSIPGCRVIPTRIDQNPCAHSRRPIDLMRQGWSIRSFQASQQWATISS